MKQAEFIQRHEQLVSCPTCYVRGAFGAVANSANKKRYKNALNVTRFKKIDATPSNGFFDDCAGVPKGILWGWDGDTSKIYGGAVYKSNGIPDFNDETVLPLLRDVSTDFSNILPGECVWIKGHIGTYVGDGVVIESTASWDCCVQKTGLGNVGKSVNGKSRKWTKHGKYPGVEYEDQPAPSTYTLDQFRTDVRTILEVTTNQQAYEKTVKISTVVNKHHALITPLERYMRSIGYYSGVVEADEGKTPDFGGGMKKAIMSYQQANFSFKPDGVLDAKGQTWKKLLLG